MSERVSVSSRGQIVIPAALRRHLGFSRGTQLEAVVEGDTLVLRKAMTIDDISAAMHALMPEGIEPLEDVHGFYDQREVEDIRD